MTDAQQAAKAPTLPVMQPLQMIGLAEVRSLLQVSSSTIYRWMEKDEFPKPFRLSENCVRWRAGEVQAWIESKTLLKTGT